MGGRDPGRTWSLNFWTEGATGAFPDSSWGAPEVPVGSRCRLRPRGPVSPGPVDPGQGRLLEGLGASAGEPPGDQRLRPPQSFREELEGLIQEQMKKGNNSSNIWALRQIADFMASTSHAVFPASSMSTWGAGELPGAGVEEARWGRAGGWPGARAWEDPQGSHP